MTNSVTNSLCSARAAHGLRRQLGLQAGWLADFPFVAERIDYASHRRDRDRIDNVLRHLYRLLVGLVSLATWTGRKKDLEILASRHQIGFLQRNAKGASGNVINCARAIKRTQGGPAI